MTDRVLITQGTRPFAQRVGQLLQNRYAVQFGSAEAIPEVLLGTGNYIQLPGAATPAFEHELLRKCLDNRVDVLIPLGEREIDLLARAQQLFAEYDIAIWIPDMAGAGELKLLRNPERRFPLLVIDHGVAVAGEQQGKYPATLSGVFAVLVPAETLALCCIAD